MMATVSKTMTTLTLAQKLEILEALKTKKPIHVAKEFSVDRSTISRIKNKANEIRHEASTSGNLNRKRKRESPNEDVGDALITWFHQTKAQNILVTGPIMLEKAKQLAITLGRPDFEPSNGWLERLKTRRNIKFVKFPKGKKKADRSIVGTIDQEAGVEDWNWMGNMQSDAIDGYDPDDVFNARETALFYKATPTLGSRSGSIMSQDRMTVLLVCNSTGSEKKAYAIGKFENPSSFKKGRPPLPYYGSADARMINRIWADILRRIDRELGDRKILLFADNQICHRIDFELRNIKIILTTRLIEPLEHGVIRAAKVYYRARILRGMIRAIDDGISTIDYAKSIDILKALHTVKRAWSLVSPTTIEHCFRKAGLSSRGDIGDLSESQPFLEDEFGELISGEDFQSYVDCDKDADCFVSLPLTDVEICDSVKRNRRKGVVGNEEEGEIVDQALPIVSDKDVLMHLATVRRYLEQNFVDYNAFYEIEDTIERHILRKRTHSQVRHLLNSALGDR